MNQLYVQKNAAPKSCAGADVNRSAILMAAALCLQIAAPLAPLYPQQDSLSNKGTESRPLIPDSLRQDAKTVIPAGICYGTFTSEDGPFLIDGSVIVPSGQILEFGPGSVVYIGGTYSTITVFGQLIAGGTENSPVQFLSAKKKPNPWDWDRIYCRSRNQSRFDHCIIRHSNYGITVENGSVDIKNCLFERNSLYAVAVKNSDVTIASSTFSRGHVCAILLSAGAHVIGDSLTITDNTTGIGCDGNARLELRGGSIQGNVNGIVATADAAITMAGTEVSHNKTGIITGKSIPKRDRPMVYANGSDEKVVGSEALKKYLTEPETVRSIVLPKTQTVIAEKENWSPGFSASSAVEEGPASSFIGNVTAGFRYFQPETFKHPVQDTVVSQTLYPQGLQPEVQVFANGKRGKTDVNLLMDIYSNSWLNTEGYFGKNMLNLGLTYDNHTLSFGDFFETGSETAMSGRQMTGIKYTGYYWDMGRGLRRMEYRLAAGESEIPRDWGHHDLRQYNVEVDSGMSMRQQLTYVMATTLRPTLNTTFSAEGIIARDQVNQPLFRTVLVDPGAPRPIESQTGVLSGTMSLLKGKLELFTEVDLGTHDTIDSAGADKIAWYNPELEDALPKIFRNFTDKEDFINHYSATIGGKGMYENYTMNLQYTEIGPHYFSAGNPYLEINRRFARCGLERQIDDYRWFGTTYEYERSMSTGTPTDRNNFNAKADYGLGENKPAFSINYLTRFETSASSERYVIETVDPEDYDSSVYAAYRYEKLTNTASVEGKQNLQNGLSYSASYQVLWDNDLSTHANVENNNIGDRFQHQVNCWLTFRLKKILRNKTSVRLTLKDENRDSLNSLAYKISDQLGLTILPRKLTLNISGELSRKTEEEYIVDTLSSIVPGWQDPLLTSFYGGGLEAKYSFTQRLSLTLKGRYEKSYDEIESSRENYLVKIIGLQMTWLF
jgi:hypothetical protein